MPLNILADENIPAVEQAFGNLGQVRTTSGRAMTADDCRDKDILLVRSVTKVDETLLRGSQVQFVASATIGEDHVDKAYLKANGIGFASAPGCNADAASEYVVTQLMALHKQGIFDFQGKQAGIIGHGNVGSRVSAKFKALGIECLINDPPRQARGAAGDYHALDALMDCDLITLHVPMERQGPHPTYHLINADVLARLKPGALIINTSRGAVIDNRALLEHLKARQRPVVLDVWEGEPMINLELLGRVQGASPHVAGYSLEGRLRGTEMIYRAVCTHLGLRPSWSPWEALETPGGVDVPESGTTLEQTRELILQCHDPEHDMESLKALHRLNDKARGRHFDQLRKNYPLRREWGYYPVRTSRNSETNTLLSQLGFRLSEHSPGAL